MKPYLKSTFVGFVALLSWTGGPAIADIVPVGSTFNVDLVESNGIGGLVVHAPITFNGVPQSFTGFRDVTVTVTESQTDLGGGRYKIDIAATSSPGQDLFAPTGNGPNAFFGIGGPLATQNPLDLAAPFDLTSAILTFTQGNGNLFASEQTIGLVVHPNPWDGFYGGSNEVIGFFASVGQDVERVDLTLEGSVAAPLPPASLGAAVLLGLIVTSTEIRRRRLREIGAR
jgi:hypothetical protein